LISDHDDAIRLGCELRFSAQEDSEFCFFAELGADNERVST